MRIGPHRLENELVLAPMAGVTDRPFRQLCRRMGAGLAVSEMLSADVRTRGTRKSRLRADHEGEPAPRSIQIAGADPAAMADAARYNEAHGAEIIDVNMGCPAKKVCRVAAGAALLQDESLVARILETVVGAVGVPVTLKLRTGWSPTQRNAVAIARIAEAAGVQAIAVHGRTRACLFSGQAEYDTIRRVKQSVRIPVIANGDIRTALEARNVLEQTGADGIMIGRAAQGRPWLFREIEYFLRTGKQLPQPDSAEIRTIVMDHLEQLYGFYGEFPGVRIARKHITWYGQAIPCWPQFRKSINGTESAREQLALTKALFDRMAA